MLSGRTGQAEQAAHGAAAWEGWRQRLRPIQDRMVLGPEQVRIVYLIAQGFTDVHIARVTRLGRSTVQRLIAHAAKELGVTGRVALVVRAIQVSIIDPTQVEVRQRAHSAPPGTGEDTTGVQVPL